MFLNALLSVIGLLFTVYFWMMIAYILMSWLPGARESAIGELIGRFVEPYLAMFRFIPPIGMIDISPIVALIAFRFLQSGVHAVIFWIAGMF